MRKRDGIRRIKGVLLKYGRQGEREEKPGENKKCVIKEVKALTKRGKERG